MSYPIERRVAQGAFWPGSKVQETLQFIREHSLGRKVFAGISGGKDSTVLLALMKMAGVKFEAWYSYTGIDPPEVLQFLKRNHPEVNIARPPKSFFSLIPRKGYPARTAKWCCDHLKKIPTKDVPLGHRFMGIRAEESTRRAGRPRIDEMKKPVKQMLYKPIFYWLEWEVWEFIDHYNLPYCPLYDEGFDRIGCAVCPVICRKDKLAVLHHMERWPKIYKAFEKAMKRLWDKKGADWWSEDSFEEFLDNWYRGRKDPKKERLPLFEALEAP